MSDFAADVELEDIVVRDTAVSSAVDEPARAMILDMLADREMTVADVHEELRERGIDRTENTVRHHVNELRDAGLVEVARFEERRGGTLKFYRANTIVLSYSVPRDAREELDAMADEVGERLAPLVDDVLAEHGDDLERIADGMAPCDHCRTQKYEAFLLLTVFRRGFVSAYREASTEN